MAEHHPPRTTAPPMRQGPRPLALHLATQGLALTSWPLGLSGWNSASAFWKPPSADCSRATGRADPPPEASGLPALLAEARARAWIRSPWPVRSMPRPGAGWQPFWMVCWHTGAIPCTAIRTLTRRRSGARARPCCGRSPTTPTDPGRRARARDGPPVVLVPSLINRASILNLGPQPGARLRALSGVARTAPGAGGLGRAGRGRTGLHPDRLCGPPGSRLRRRARDAPAASPWCWGTAWEGCWPWPWPAAKPDDMAGLALLATPWDFHADRAAAQGRLAPALAPWIDPVLKTHDTLPVDLLQAAFAAIDPPSIGRKFRAFAALPPHGAAHVISWPWKIGLMMAFRWLAGLRAKPCAAGTATMPPRAGTGGWMGASSRRPRTPAPHWSWCPEARPYRAGGFGARPGPRPAGTVEVLEPPLGHVGMITGRARHRPGA